MSIETPASQREVWSTAPRIPPLTVPDGWQQNGGMVGYDGRQKSLRSLDWRYHIDLNGVPELADIEGPYWAELRLQIGGHESFRTEPLHRLTGIERGAIQDAVYLLVGKAIEHELEGSA